MNRRSARLAALVALVGVLSTLAAAQGPDFREPAVSFPGAERVEPIEPETEQVKIPLLLRVGCNEGDANGGSTKVAWQVVRPNASGFASLEVERAVAERPFDAVRCFREPDYREAFHNNLTVMLTREARAFATLRVVVEATIDKPRQDPVVDPQRFGPYRSTVSFQAAYVPVLNVYAPTHFLESPPGANFSFPLRYENLGNGPAEVDATLRQASNESQLRLPPRVILAWKGDAPAEKAHTIEMTVDGVAPPQQGAMETFVLAFEARSAEKPDSRADLQEFVFTVRTPLSLAPGTDLVLAAGAALGASVVAAWVRRTRKT